MGKKHRDPRPLSALSESERAEAMKRYGIIQPCVEEGALPAEVARRHDIPLRTVKRWSAQYRDSGLAGLARSARSDRGSRRQLPTELQQFIEGLALRKPPPSIAFVHRQACDMTRGKGWKTPPYHSVYRIVKQLDPALLTLAHEGSKAYRLAFDLLYRREAGASNEIWQADHTLLDLWVKQDSGPPARSWLSVIIDDFSRAVAGFRLSFHAPSAIQTALVLHQAIWNKSLPQWQVCGVPATFYTDHGSDFTSQHLEQVAADLKMVLVFSEAGMPRGRGRIERFFRTINQMLLCGLPGYTPAGVPDEKTLLTLSGFEAQLRKFILDEYHQHPHSETGLPPQARWAAGGFLPRLPESLEQLDLLLLTVPRGRKVRQDGIHFQGLRYLDLALTAYVGEQVIIRYDPRDMAEIRVYQEGKFLCRAICQELAGETIALREIIKARNRRRRTLRQTIEERSRVVESLLEAHRGSQTVEEPVPVNDAASTMRKGAGREATAQLKRYRNE
jgi:putative transposase